jgi:predicted nuclease of predicted toxin-antitoxin system
VQFLVISEHEDFPDRAVLGGEAPVVIWVRVGNTTRQALLDWFDPLLDRVFTMIDAGERLVELR